MKTLTGTRQARVSRYALSLGLLLALLAACDLYGTVGMEDTNFPGTLPELLRGEWVFPEPATGAPPADGYIIRTGEGDTLRYIDHSGAGFSFKGNIVFVSNWSGTSGVMIIRFIEYPDWDGHNGNSYSAIFYRNLGTSSVQLANAIVLSDLSAPDTATLEEAIENFTRGRIGRYVDWGAVQPQTRAR